MDDANDLIGLANQMGFFDDKVQKYTPNASTGLGKLLKYQPVLSPTSPLSSRIHQSSPVPKNDFAKFLSTGPRYSSSSLNLLVVLATFKLTLPNDMMRNMPHK